MERSCSSHGSRSRCPELLNGDASMTLSISSTTGTRFELSVPRDETVQGLKRRLSEKLRVPGERLLLLHRDTRLISGKLLDFGVSDGSRLTLVPSVEAGLMSQSSRSEQSVVQALETLSDAQVSDFLSGRSPLTLALRVGDHMMFVQLQLASQPSVSRGPAGPNQTPTGAVSSETPSDSHQRAPDVTERDNAPPSPHVHHAHSTQSPAPALHSHPVSHALPPQSPAQAPPCTQAGTPSPRQRCRPGAVIESLVNHSPGVFSGTFSGTLHPNCQDSSGRPRRDISTILQILNDLLSATQHCQGSPPTLTHLRCPPTSPCSPPPSPTSPLQPHTLLRRPSGERLRQTENKATRCKVEQLRLLLQQRRLRRKARRDTRGPYHWPSDRSTALTGHSSLDLPSDRSAEFVLA
ncbi:midnolin [Carassius gibelio]|uniref:midnolin n=1 Tax=Carassius gibelio TaxID=101364 RepID=UPI002278932A|nr:midnolin [Carassius gibelio]